MTWVYHMSNRELICKARPCLDYTTPARGGRLGMILGYVS